VWAKILCFYARGTGKYSYHCLSNDELHLPLLHSAIDVLFCLLSSDVTGWREVAREAEAPGSKGAHLQGLPEGLPRSVHCTKCRV
jgi:hypothetical protein